MILTLVLVQVVEAMVPKGAGKETTVGGAMGKAGREAIRTTRFRSWTRRPVTAVSCSRRTVMVAALRV